MGILKSRKLMFIAASIISFMVLPLSGNSLDKKTQLTFLSANKNLQLTSTEIISALKSTHYNYIDINDDFSKQLLTMYIKKLDITKSHFLKRDIDEFQQYQDSLDNALTKANLHPAFVIFNRYQQRAEERINWLLEQLKNEEAGINDFDFTIKEDFDPLNKNGQWSTNPSELHNLWRKRLKSNVLDLRLAGKVESEIKETLEKRFTYQRQRLQQTNSNDAFEFYMNIVTKSYDPHTQYFAPHQSENFNIAMSRSLEGIGAVLQYDQEHTKVVRLIAGGPADKNGKLHPSDHIIGVGQGKEGVITNVIGWRLEDVVNLIRGAKGTTVRLQVTSTATKGNQPAHEISIVRNRVELEDQKAKKEIIKVSNAGTTRRIGVINIPSFYMDFDAYLDGDPNYISSTRDVKQLVQELKKEKVDGIIIDLRNNGGGSLPEVNSLVGLFINHAASVQIKQRNGQVNLLSNDGPNAIYSGPLAVIVNRLSASASEIFAGAIQDYQRGIVLGSATFGKGTVQSLIPLRHGQLKITRSKFYRISGKTTQHQGVKPDIIFPTAVDVNEIGENALDNALSWDKIRPILHNQAGQLAAFIPQLDDLHNQRIKNAADYQYRINKIKKAQLTRQQKTVSLDESQRKQQQQSYDDWQLDLENTRLKGKGLPTIKLLSERDTEEITNNDPYLIESTYILSDFIDIKNKQLTQEL